MSKVAQERSTPLIQTTESARDLRREETENKMITYRRGVALNTWGGRRRQFHTGENGRVAGSGRAK